MRAVFAAQDGRQRGGWVAPAVTLTGDPQTLEIAHRLLTISIATRAAFGREPLIAPLIIDMAAYATLEDQIRLARDAAGHRPGGLPRLAARRDTSADAAGAVAAPAAVAGAGGVRVLLAKAGRLRAFALALGIGGFETGLGASSASRSTISAAVAGAAPAGEVRAPASCSPRWRRQLAAPRV